MLVGCCSVVADAGKWVATRPANAPMLAREATTIQRFQALTSALARSFGIRAPRSTDDVAASCS
ncbi:hypothetical protein KSF_039300 [Reticulibacter mediterranei]|uniref:Uncharacterized protein n=1 Tax=Reticulibacter mediterranei TaxID=2778369 RepID=A0A8J3IMI7_9CHLR|nr:hypothetical protein KSF_039300 [Reticulibacter mediterranei]